MLHCILTVYYRSILGLLLYSNPGTVVFYFIWGQNILVLSTTVAIAWSSLKVSLGQAESNHFRSLVLILSGNFYSGERITSKTVSNGLKLLVHYHCTEAHPIIHGPEAYMNSSTYKYI